MVTVLGLEDFRDEGKNGEDPFPAEGNLAPSRHPWSLAGVAWEGQCVPGKRRLSGESLNISPAHIACISPRFSTYDSTCQIAQEIAEKIQQRNRYERNGENTTKLTVTIRALLQNLKEKIALLKDLLLRAVSTHQITQLEGDRRQNLLDDLVTRERLLLASFKNEGAEPDLIRSSLMTGGAKRGVPSPWLLEEPEETRGLGVDGIRQQQQQIIQVYAKVASFIQMNQGLG
nr:syntaxin-8-like [Manis javanica]